jgi:hypothetical protein
MRDFCIIKPFWNSKIVLKQIKSVLEFWCPFLVMYNLQNSKDTWFYMRNFVVWQHSDYLTLVLVMYFLVYSEYAVYFRGWEKFWTHRFRKTCIFWNSLKVYITTLTLLNMINWSWWDLVTWLWPLIHLPDVTYQFIEALCSGKPEILT